MSYLPNPPLIYNSGFIASAFQTISQSLLRSYQKGSDVELNNAQSLILTSPNGTRYKIEVDNSGALSTTAL